MKQIPVGAKGSFRLLVQPEHLANRFKDAMLPPVLATPVMIMVVRRQGFWDNGLGKIREALAHRFGEVRRRAADAASGGWRWSVV